MLKCRDPRIIHELHNVLPQYGENRSVFLLADGIATLVVEYDGEGGKTSCVNLTFDDVSAVYSALCPGVSLCAFNCEQKPNLLGELIEFGESAAADEWTKYRHWSKRPTKHFQLILLHANERFDIFAEGWRVGTADVDSGACNGAE